MTGYMFNVKQAFKEGLSMKRQKIKGFTLLELMITIGIMAVLAMILMVRVQRAREQGALSACLLNMRNISLAIEQYMVDNKNQIPPPDLDHVVPDYIRDLPKNHKNVEYGYLSEQDTRIYTIYCPGLSHAMLNVPADYPRYCSPGGQLTGIPGVK